MISEQSFNLFLIEHDTLIRYGISIGFAIVMLSLFWWFRYLLSKSMDIPKEIKEVMLFIFSAMGMISFIPFVGIFFIVLGTILKYIFIK